jgi:hypothetical protein
MHTAQMISDQAALLASSALAPARAKMTLTRDIWFGDIAVDAK